MNLQELRREIDKVDDQMVRLFVRRMGIAAQIADYKKDNGLPVFVPAREQEKLFDISEKAGPEMAHYAQMLYSLIFELSRDYQCKHTNK